jgi:hypothetical protein
MQFAVAEIVPAADKQTSRASAKTHFGYPSRIPPGLHPEHAVMRVVDRRVERYADCLLGVIRGTRWGIAVHKILIPLRSYFQSFQKDIACDLKVRKLPGLHFTGELSPSSGNIAFAHTSVLSSTSFIHLRQLNTVAL